MLVVLATPQMLVSSLQQNIMMKNFLIQTQIYVTSQNPK